MPFLRKISEKVTENVKTRNHLKSIPSVQSFDSLLEQSTLSDLDKEILRLHYLKEKDFRYIGDILGYAETTIKKRHLKALSKIKHLF